MSQDLVDLALAIGTADRDLILANIADIDLGVERLRDVMRRWDTPSPPPRPLSGVGMG